MKDEDAICHCKHPECVWCNEHRVEEPFHFKFELPKYNRIFLMSEFKDMQPKYEEGIGEITLKQNGVDPQ